jgi:hypothetical protein
MNKNKFLKVYTNVKNSIRYMDYPTELKGYIVEKYKFTFLENDELEKNIKSLLEFDINKLWDKQFWGLMIHESICAIATEPYNYLIKLKENNER